MGKDEKLRDRLFAVLGEKGAKLMAAGDLTGIVKDSCTVGVSVAIPLPRHVVRDLQTAPTAEYYQLYHDLNGQLDGIVEAGAAFLREQGYEARANTTKTVRQDESWRTPPPQDRGHPGGAGVDRQELSAGHAGVRRGHPPVQSGDQRPLPVSEPVAESRCGECRICADRCPARALTGKLWQAGMAREELFQREICKQTQEDRMERATGIRADLCGMCFAVCPYTRRYLDRS